MSYALLLVNGKSKIVKLKWSYLLYEMFPIFSNSRNKFHNKHKTRQDESDKRYAVISQTWDNKEQTSPTTLRVKLNCFVSSAFLSLISFLIKPSSHKNESINNDRQYSFICRLSAYFEVWIFQDNGP